MKYFLTLVIGVLLGIGIHWYAMQPKGSDPLVNARERVKETSDEVGNSLKSTFDSGKIKDELARTGKVIREKAEHAGNVIADATANARISTTIKAKLIKESHLSAFKIDVDTTDGVVTLSGTVSSYDQIGRAIDLALETDGVTKVISTLQVKAN